MSVFKAAYPHARPLEPAIKGRSGIPTVAWRKLFGSQKLILSIPKSLAAQLDFAFTPGAKNYAECAHLAIEGCLLVANVSGRTDSTARWTVQNRQNTMTLTIKPDWIRAGTPDMPATGCVFRVEDYTAGRVLVVVLPDWAAAQRVELQTSKGRGFAAVAEAVEKVREARSDAVPGISGFSMFPAPKLRNI